MKMNISKFCFYFYLQYALIRKEHVFWRGSWLSWLIQNFQNMSHQKIYTLWYCVVNDELPSTSTEIFEQTGVMQKVVVPGISELKDLVPDKKWEDQTQFSSKKDSRKEQCI